jgi:hypothetical protein
MFNRSYQIRSRAGGLVSVGQIIQELVERADAKQSFYRPSKRVSPRGAAAKACKKGSERLQGVQLELPFPFPQATPARAIDAERPLLDLFPEAYQQ